MKINKKHILATGVMLLFLGTVVSVAFFRSEANASDLGYTPVVTPNGSTLPWTMEDGVKTFRVR